jgi:hypothetical protein
MAINGVSTPDCLRALIKRQIRDGYNKTYPIWILSNYFKEYYGFLYGHPDRFTITCKNSRGIVENRVVSAISKDSIRVNGNLRYPRYFSKSPVNQGILLELDNPMFTGILTIKTFDRDILRSQYKQEFDVEFRKAFKLLEIHGIKRLVLDLRDNQGGDFGPGITLLSYLLKSPVQYLKGSKEQQLIQPLKNGFKGDLYILVNGGSFSSTAILCSYLEQTKRGTFIGEETAGNRNLISGDPMDLVLPNTHIVCSISTVRYRISERINDGHGIIPSQRIDCAVRDIISGRDPVKNFAMDLIVKKAAAD